MPRSWPIDGLPRQDPISVVNQPPRGTQFFSCTEQGLNDTQLKHIETLQATLDGMHQRVSDVEQKKNDAAIRRKNKHGMSPENFEIGDFVLSGMLCDKQKDHVTLEETLSGSA